MTTLRAAGVTDPGQVRPMNQDTFHVADDLVLIADGMGGYAGGEVAAAIAAEVVGSHFAADGSAHGLEDALRDANRQIYERGVEPGLEGMGTTLVAAAVVESDTTARLLVANVGDSRGYLLRDGTLRQLTEDHSVAAELVRLGRLDEVEGAEHPGRHVLTRALGVDRDVEPDLIEVAPLEGDRILLCSDGLSNELGDADILRLLSVGEPSDAARALVAAANAHGGLDNITAVVADVVDPAERGAGAEAAASASAAVISSPANTSSVPPVVARPVSVDATGASIAHGVFQSVAVRPVLTGRERRRRRREDRRERRRFNKWISIRGVAFLLALAGVAVGGYFVLRWYGTSNYVVTVRANRVVVLQGQNGGFLWWPQKVVVREHFGVHQIPLEQRPQFATGMVESSLTDAKAYIANWHKRWEAVTGGLPTTTTTTTTTLTPSSFTTGGT